MYNELILSIIVYITPLREFSDICFRRESRMLWRGCRSAGVRICGPVMVRSFVVLINLCII